MISANLERGHVILKFILAKIKKMRVNIIDVFCFLTVALILNTY